MKVPVALSAALLLVLALCLATCMGGSPSTDSVTGSVFAAPVSGATVSFKDSSGSVITTPVTTGSDGTFSLPDASGLAARDIVVESSGGTYVDEATGATTTAGKLAAYAPQGSLSDGASVNLDPSSTILSSLVTTHGKTLDQAKTIFSAAFGYTPDATVAPKNAPSSGTDVSQSLAALRAMVFSQLTKDLGLSPDKQFDLLVALAADLSDGALDGMNGTNAVPILTGTNLHGDIQNDFEMAFMSMLSNTAVNKTGLTPDKTGTLPFSKTVLSTSYKVEYVAGTAAAAEGKTVFTIRLSDKASGTAASGKSISLTPKMYMATYSHSAPVDPVVDNGDGTYGCTVYYPMPSGAAMGIWELKVTMGGTSPESVYFYPPVNMAMSTGPTARALLKGITDLIPPVSPATPRTYRMFYDGMGGAGVFKLCITTWDDKTVVWPHVSVGTVLHDQNNTAWTVTTMVVEAATSTTGTWYPATDNGNGHWSVTLPGFAGGTVYVRLNVNGEQKTTTGTSAGIGYQTYNNIPAM